MIQTYKLPAENESGQDIFEKVSNMDTNESISIDASGVERIKTPALQVLLSLEKTLVANGQSLSVSPRSEYFNKFCGILGATQLLSASE